MTIENMTYFFCENPKKIRKSIYITQQELADKLMVKRSLIGAIEEGRTLSLETVYKVSREFGYTIDELITTKI